MVGIRAMTVRGADARLSAGVGIVDGSVPDIELVETNLKLTAVLDALVPGLTPPTPAGSRASAT
jgi:menaquinone-specific isochorismate synthase